MVAHRYWRLRSNDTTISGDYMGAMEIELRGTPAGPDLTGSGTASASAAFIAAANAVDNNGATMWTTGGNAPPSGGHWWKYDFGAGNEKDIQEVVYTVRTDSAREDPRNIFIEWSDDDVTYHEKWSVSGMAAWVAGETRTWTIFTAANIRLTQARARTLLGEEAAQLRASQLRVRTLISYPAEEAQASQVRARVMAGGAFGEAQLSQALVRLLIKFGADDRRARAWHFPQDDHDFYVLNLGNGKTIVFDCLTRQWCSWKSPFIQGWRAIDGFAWEQENVGGDLSAGLMWNIDPEARSDDDSGGGIEARTNIRTVVRGMLPLRLRNALGCYRATLTVAQGAPASAGVGITLRTSVDEGLSWTNHGELVMDQIDEVYDISWVGLGQITEPGMIFEIIDTGYTRRINALDVDLGEEEGKVGND